MGSAFQFTMPLELLEKDQRGWKIRGVASTEDRDLQGEIVKQNGLDFSHIKKGLGLFNWNHKNDPQYILGKIDDARVEDKQTVVEGYLFEKADNAKALVQIMQSLKPEDKQRVQMSIEGKIVERGGPNEKVIRQAKVEKVALTLDAVNPNTYVQLAKSLTAQSDLEPQDQQVLADEMLSVPRTALQAMMQKTEQLSKMLTAGAGYADAPGNLSGGAALTQESLESDVKNTKVKRKKKKKVMPEEEIDLKKKPAEKAWATDSGRTLFKSIVVKFKQIFPHLEVSDVVKMAEDYIECRLHKGLPIVPPRDA